MVRVTGLVPPIATPFRDAKLDLDSLKRMLEDLAPNVSGVLVGGSVGENPSLTLEERITLMREVSRFFGGSGHQLALSIADNAIDTARRLSDAAGEAGADVLMVMCPNYFTNDRAMLEAFFAAVSEFASAEMCLYDNPLATNTSLSVDDIRALAQAAPRLTHVKVTDTSLGKVEELRRRTDLTVLSGDEVVLWHHLTEGAHGAMVGLPMVYPQQMAAIWHAFSRGDWDAMVQEYRQVAPFIHVALGAPDFVAVLKTVLHLRGIIASPEVRLPLVPLSPTRNRQVLQGLEMGLRVQSPSEVAGS